MQKTYLFYDLETTGKNKCFDQVLQFAAIRTDLELNELSRHSIQVKLNSDVIPDPEAILIHHIPVETMLEGLPEIKAIEQIHALLNQPGTLSIGYNTLGFDDEFLRFSFYRNLLPPYNHQWANECGRVDLYPITILYFLYKPNLLHWPTIDNKPSLKLERLNAENHLADGAAHNAMVDVEATLALAKLLFQDRAMWDYATAYFDKNLEAQRIKKLHVHFQHGVEGQQLALMIGEAGATDFYHFPVLSLGQHYHYKNQTLWLRLDKEELSKTIPDDIATTTWVVRKKAGEPGLLLPFHTRFTQHLTAARIEIMEKNLAWLQNNLDLLTEIKEYYREFTYPKVPNIDADAALYDNGFLAPMEQKLAQLFHQSPIEKKTQVTEKFTNPTLQQLAIRILGRHYPQNLTPEFSQQFDSYLKKIYSAKIEDACIDYRGQQRLTLSAALNSIQKLRTDRDLDAHDQTLLSELEAFLRAKHYG